MNEDYTYQLMSDDGKDFLGVEISFKKGKVIVERDGIKTKYDNIKDVKL